MSYLNGTAVPVFGAFDHKGRGTAVGGKKVSTFGGEVRAKEPEVEKIGSVGSVGRFWGVSDLYWFTALRCLLWLGAWGCAVVMSSMLMRGLRVCVTVFPAELFHTLGLGHGLVALDDSVRVMETALDMLVRAVSGTFGTAFLYVGLPRALMLVVLCERVIVDERFRRVVMMPGLTEWIVVGLSQCMLLLCSVVGNFSDVSFFLKGVSVIMSTVIVLISFPAMVRRVYDRHGEVGVCAFTCLQAISCGFGFFSMLIACPGFYVLGRVFAFRGSHFVVERSKVYPVLGISRRYQEIARCMAVDMSRVCTLLPDSCLDDVGAVCSGGKESDLLRRFAYVGDRAMALALAMRATRESWPVASSSVVSQTVLTNAAFARWFDDGGLLRVFPSFKGRSEARKGTLVEALVGAAFVSGCSLVEVEVFVFAQVARVLGVRISERGAVLS